MAATDKNPDSLVLVTNIAFYGTNEEKTSYLIGPYGLKDHHQNEKKWCPTDLIQCVYSDSRKKPDCYEILIPRWLAEIKGWPYSEKPVITEIEVQTHFIEKGI